MDSHDPSDIQGAIAALVRELGESGREITATELRRARTYLATVVLPRQAWARADRDIGGYEWAAKVVRGGEFMDALGAKYLLHVVLRQEWPIGTTPRQYQASLAQATLAPSSGLSLGRDAGSWSMSVVTRSGRWRGPGGGPYILVVFLPEKGLWLTGFQPRTGLDYVLSNQMRMGGRWLKRPD